MDYKDLHIVSFDYPYPPTYGGIIDVFYKIKALHQAGAAIHLHYFADSKKSTKVLEGLCASVQFYPKSSLTSTKLVSSIPFRMLLRRNKALVDNLSKTNYPILYEGLQSSFSSKSPQLSNVPKFLRCHNVESEYAAQLSRIENDYFKKIAFKLEAYRTKIYENNLSQFERLFAITKHDVKKMSNAHAKVNYLPVFHGHDSIQIKKGLGDYIIFHGNLTVKENLETAQWISNILSKQIPAIQFVIAGRSDHANLQKDLIKRNVKCVLNPGKSKMQELIQNAQIVLLKTSIPSGVKLKLIDSLAQARHIIADENSVKFSGLQDLVNLANSTKEVKEQIDFLISKEVNEQEIAQRQVVFTNELNNQSNAKKLMDEIFKYPQTTTEIQRQ